MNDKPDFDALRAERNAQIGKWEAEMKAEGWDVGSCAHRDRNACYCACGNGGPCEHDWDGEPYQSTDGSTWSATCSKCGMTAMSHSLRN